MFLKHVFFFGGGGKLNMLNVFELTDLSRRTPEKTFNITTVRNIFFKNVFLSAEMLNILNVFLECF